MYLEFYGLQAKPFGVTPDPKFLHLTQAHREALAHLVYGVRERRGFMVLTGEAGTGKTTLLQALVRRLDSQVAFAFVFNSTLPFPDIVAYMIEDFGIVQAGDSQARRLIALNNFLLQRRRAGQDAALIIDEAQNLSVETLEQVRLLSNFETTSEKLLQTVLAGQPELDDTLQHSQLRQFRQRVALRCHIPPLTRQETHEYVATRLRIAGARDSGPFTDAAIDRIAKCAGGIPRTVNLLCDHCLVIGYADQIRRIGADIVDEAMANLDGHRAGARRPRHAPARRLPARASSGSRVAGRRALVAVVVGVIAALTLSVDVLDPVRSAVGAYLFDLWRSMRHLLVR
jgi:type II secretory pathway predicted ATPase ExeA